MSQTRPVWRITHGWTGGVSLAHLFLTIWAWCMIVVGLMAFIEFPSRLHAPAGFWTTVGITLIAMGEFVAAVTADRLFPGADRRLTAIFQVAAWLIIGITLTVALAGGSL